MRGDSLMFERASVLWNVQGTRLEVNETGARDNNMKRVDVAWLFGGGRVYEKTRGSPATVERRPSTVVIMTADMTIHGRIQS